MLKATLLAAATLVAFGATAAYAGGDGGRGHRGYDHGDRGGYEYNYEPRREAGHRHHYRHHESRHWRPYGPSWFKYRGRSYCHYEPRRVPTKVWDRRGHSHRTWVWKDVKVCV